LGSDKDGNGVFDEWEYELAKKFCPVLKLHSGDRGGRPVPVEIMDRNGDGKLGSEDIIVEVIEVATRRKFYNIKPTEIKFSTNEYEFENFFPNYDAYMKNWARVRNSGLNMYEFIVHLEWGNDGDTKPESWYSYWEQVLSQHLNDSRYTKGTTYAHLFKDGDDIVIQYWFFYPFNAAANRHEGDWEHVNVVVSCANPENSKLIEVVYYYHRNYMIETDPELYNNFHPLVYVGGYTSSFGINGHGTHASYPKPGEYVVLEKASYRVIEKVDGNGLLINFDNYRNVVILPSLNIFKYNETVMDNNGNDLHWLKYNALWGYPSSYPTAFDWQSNIINFFADVLFFGYVEPVEELGNLAPVGPQSHKTWEKRR
jgi:hypothetical protein